MFEVIIKYMLGESRTLRNAPASAIIITLAIFSVVWIAMDWRYAGNIANRDGTIANREAAINLISAQRDDYKDKLGGASPDQAKSRMDALEKDNAALSARLSAISTRIKPTYPLEDEEKDTLVHILREVPKTSRFHVDIFWPQFNGNPENAHLIAELFWSAQWDVSVKMAASISGHGLVFAFNPDAAADDSKRPSDARALMELFRRANIDWAVDALSDVPKGHFSFIVGEPR